MGIDKNRSIEKDDYRSIAFEILSEVKAIDYCACGKIYRQGENFDKAYEYSNAEVKKRRIENFDFKLFGEAVHDILKEAWPAGELDECET